MALCYLPYRQLRNFDRESTHQRTGYLPYRQFRNCGAAEYEIDKRYLPYRQVIYFIVLFLWLTSDGG